MINLNQCLDNNNNMDNKDKDIHQCQVNNNMVNEDNKDKDIHQCQVNSNMVNSSNNMDNMVNKVKAIHQCLVNNNNIKCLVKMVLVFGNIEMVNINNRVNMVNMDNIINMDNNKKNGQVKEMVIQDLKIINKDMAMMKNLDIIDKIINLKTMDSNKLNFNKWIIKVMDTDTDMVEVMEEEEDIINMVSMVKDLEVEVVVEIEINMDHMGDHSDKNI